MAFYTVAHLLQRGNIYGEAALAPGAVPADAITPEVPAPRLSRNGYPVRVSGRIISHLSCAGTIVPPLKTSDMRC